MTGSTTGNTRRELFDAHLHIIDNRFPLVPNHGFLPEAFTCADYLNRMQGYTLLGGAVVSGSFQGSEQAYLLHALARLGPSFVGVTQLPATVADDELLRLNTLGVRAIRFNLQRGGSEDIRHLEHLARRVHEVVGWHVELYADARELADLFDTLVSLPAVSIDHLGLSRAGFATVVRLAEKGVKIKATGFGRGDLEVGRALRDLYAANPEALMFGTDLPSTRAARPYTEADYALVRDTLGEAGATRVFFANALMFYKPRAAG